MNNDITELTAKLKAAAIYEQLHTFMAVKPGDILALTEALEAAEKRIAELEARTFTVKLPTSIEPMDFAPWTAKAFWALHRDTVQRCRDSFKESCAAAGIKLQIEGE